jgi:hypothetical protein
MNDLIQQGDSSITKFDECVEGTLEEDSTFYFVDVIFLVSSWAFPQIINSHHHPPGRELLFQSAPSLFRNLGRLPGHVPDAGRTERNT